LVHGSRIGLLQAIGAVVKIPLQGIDGLVLVVVDAVSLAHLLSHEGILGLRLEKDAGEERNS
ncbi:MAG TPA: hypothetical protein VKQ08_00135, partial [Cyclobacteriaceae bacterium]|nr:hypothetical protein [Cyclobacteriaceae bacterium]